MSQQPANRPNDSARPRPRMLPPYRVVLLQDAHNDLVFIIRTVMELTRFCRAEATNKMWQAHHSGRAVLLVTYRERAELFAEQFISRGLDVVVEPA
jgi:ATP-dependent Clp protease adaptor protein ClpS